MTTSILVDALEKIQENPYPIDIFIPLTKSEWGYIKSSLKVSGISMDRLSADIARQVRKKDVDLATQALADYHKSQKEDEGGFVVYENHKKICEPEVQSLDLATVATLRSSSPNSIEQKETHPFKSASD